MLEPISVVGLIIGLLAIMCASLSGVFLIWSISKNRLLQWMPYLISLSAGLFVFVCYKLYLETFHFLSASDAVFWIGIGFLAVTILTLVVPDGHHHLDDDEQHDHSGMARRILFGDAIHNIADGILLVPAFVIDFRLGLVTAAGIFLHEFIQEVSEFIILKDAGYSTKKALLWNFAVSSTVILGSIVGIATANSENFVGPILGLSTGAFAFLVVYDLFPRMFNAGKTAKKPFVLAAFLAGIAILAIFNGVFGHDHEASDHDHDHTEESHEEESHDEESEDHSDEEEHDGENEDSHEE